MQVNSPCGEQKRRNALAEMQSLNPSAVVWQRFISLYWPFYIYLYSAGYTGSPEHLMSSQIVNSRWILRLYKRPHISVCALIHQVVVFGSCRPAQESTRFFFFVCVPIPRQIFYVCLAFLWHSIKCKLETLNCVFFFFFFFFHCPDKKKLHCFLWFDASSARISWKTEDLGAFDHSAALRR